MRKEEILKKHIGTFDNWSLHEKKCVLNAMDEYKHLTEQEQPNQSLDNAVDEAINSIEFKGMLEQVYSIEQPKQRVVSDKEINHLK